MYLTYITIFIFFFIFVQLSMETLKKTRQKRVSPMMVASRYCSEGKDQDGFEVKYIDASIGKGLFTTKIFSQWSFLLEFRGIYSRGSDKDLENTYLYYYEHNSQKIARLMHQIHHVA